LLTVIQLTSEYERRDMARQQRNMEGDNEQRRRAASRARAEGKSASEAGVSLGASKQRREAKNNSSHQEKVDSKSHGKRGSGTSGKPRPGNRERDPKRTDRWE
jgi:hypothetical protein